MNHKINLEALHYYLSYGYVPAPLTIFEGISKQMPVDFSYLKWAPIHNLSEEEIIDKLDELLQKNIRNNLDAKTGVFTGGGVDTGLVTAIAAKTLPVPIHTFTLTYTGELETETKRLDKEYARQISEIYKTKHHEVNVSLDDFPTALPAILKYIGEPCADLAMSLYFVVQTARQYINRALTGWYGETLFGWTPIISSSLQGQTDKLCKAIADAPWEVMYERAMPSFNDEEKQKLYNNEIYNKVKDYSIFERLKSYYTGLTAYELLNKILELEYRHTSVTLDMVLDKLARAHSLEMFSPFSTEEFMQFAAKIPSELKIRAGEAKYILKKLALRYFPEKIVYRKKGGVTFPMPEVVLGLEQYVRQTLSPANLSKHNLFNIEYIQNLVEEFYGAAHCSLVYSLMWKIWLLLLFQVWYNESY